jgi:hypothetical protein
VPDRSAAGAPELLYVARGADGTIIRADARTGWPVGAPLPAGPAPTQLAVGRDGALLVRSGGASRWGALTYVVPSGGGPGGGPTARRVSLGEGGTAALLAGDGDRTAVVAYLPRGLEGLREAGTGAAPAPCRLAVVDLARGAVVGAHPACAPGERVTGLAVATDGAGTVAYLGLWRAGGAGRGGRGRVLALDAARGAILAAAPLDGAPGDLGVGPAPDRPGPRLYVTVAALEPEDDAAPDDDARFGRVRGGRLLGLDAATLAQERDHPLAGPPGWLTVAPDGHDAYALVHDGSGSAAGWLQRIDLTTGAASLLGQAPGLGLAGLAVTTDRLYVPDTFGDRLWIADRGGRPLGDVAIGRRPAAVALGVPR